MHTTSACVCDERRMLAFEKSLAWHPRQVSSTSRGPITEKARMVALPPRASTCAFPGPWQLSHPVRSGGSLPEAMLL